MIVLDLEWNRGYDRTPLDEILQIGAVRINELGGPVCDTFNVYIRPVVHKKFDLGAKKLPELQASRESDLDFVTAIERFRDWCGTETEYAVWGGDDLSAINKSCEYWKVPPLEMKQVYNFQQALSCVAGTGQQIALWRAVEYCKIPDTFTFHNALNDALYTAVLSRWLTKESLTYRPAPAQRVRTARRRISLKLSSIPFPTQPSQTVGPFQTQEMVWNARESRRPPCPLCGRKGCVNQWRLAPKREDELQNCFSIFSCPDHGRFLCQMLLDQQEDGGWCGRLTVPAISPELIGAYISACQGSVYVCKSSGKSRWHHKRARSSRRKGKGKP